MDDALFTHFFGDTARDSASRAALAADRQPAPRIAAAPGAMPHPARLDDVSAPLRGAAAGRC